MGEGGKVVRVVREVVGGCDSGGEVEVVTAPWRWIEVRIPFVRDCYEKLIGCVISVFEFVGFGFDVIIS